MKLCSVFIVWDDWKLLEYSIKNASKWSDKIIVIWSQYSNYGDYSPRPDNFLNDIVDKFIQFEPDLKNLPRDNETLKRNVGLEWALKSNCTHFLMLDADECYTQEDILNGREQANNCEGLVCRSKVYFKSPTLTIGFDTTLVPFIHKLTPELKFGMNFNYPFAWTDTDQVPFTPNRRIRIDPTRQLNLTSGVQWSEAIMHHYSYIRSDLKKKIQNSTARVNLERSTILHDYVEAKEGYFCEFYKKRLESCPNLFGIPEITDENLSS